VVPPGFGFAGSFGDNSENRIEAIASQCQFYFLQAFESKLSSLLKIKKP
jgi:hypothetical protein